MGTERLLGRLLAGLGVVAAGAGQACGTSSSSAETTQGACYTPGEYAGYPRQLTPSGACLPATDSRLSFLSPGCDASGFKVTSGPTSTAGDGGVAQCCYVTTFTRTNDVCGRPLLVDSRPRIASLTRRAGWSLRLRRKHG